MYFGKFSIILLVVACVITIEAQMKVKRKMAKKTKIKKPILSNIGVSACGCQNPLIDIMNCGCRGQIIEPVYAPMEVAIPSPVIDVPNYRYADPIEINNLGCLYPTYDIPSYGIVTQPMAVPGIDYIAPILEVPCGCSGSCSCPGACGCPGSQCGCRAPAIKLPSCPCGSLTSIDVPKCGCQNLQLPGNSYGISSVIELPSYGPLVVSACGCQGSCGCAGIPISSCDCLGTCGCSGIQISSPCGFGIPLSSCDCSGPCSCAAIPVSSCGCSGPCGCGIQVSCCDCNGPCGCSGLQLSSCGCNGPCACPSLPVPPCGCLGPCGCPGIQMPSYGCQLPAVEVPSCGCGCGVTGCGCNPKYLRQVTLQPPFL